MKIQTITEKHGKNTLFERDINSHKNENRYELIIFDMDGVLVDGESSWRIVHDYYGVSSEDNLKLFLEGRIDDKEFMRKDIHLWLKKKKKIHISEIENILSKAPLMSGLKEVFAGLKERNIKTAIVSGGIDIVANNISRMVGGVDYIYINSLETDEHGYLTGEGILRVELKGKDKAVKDLFRKSRVNPENTIAVGDHFIDVNMFRLCGKSIAFNATSDMVRQNADIVIDEKNLSLILDYI